MFDWYVYADTKNIRDFNNFLAFFKILVLNKFKAAYIKLKKAGLLEQFKVKKKKCDKILIPWRFCIDTLFNTWQYF